MHFSLYSIRVILRIVACVFEFIALWIAIAANVPTGFAYTGAIETPIIAIALIWNVSEFITLCINKKGIHPGAHIALDFLLFGALFGSGITDVVFWPNWAHESFCSGACPRVSPSAMSSGLGAGAMEIIAALVQLSLFVLNCIAVHQRRKSHSQPYHPKTSKAAFEKPELPGEGIPLPLQLIAPASAGLPGQNMSVSPARTPAELPANLAKYNLRYELPSAATASSR